MPARHTVDERLRLLHGPYQAPVLRVGDRTHCLFRDCEVVVTNWTDAPISWLRCLPVGRKGCPSLLVDGELARALRTESAAAVGHWWGAAPGVVSRWRKAAGVGMENPGSRRLIRAAALKGGRALHDAAAARRRRFGAPPSPAPQP